MADEKEMLLVIRDAADRLVRSKVITPSPTSKDALLQLQAALARHQLWLLHSNESDSSPATSRLTPCKYCTTLIFFAQDVTERYIPFEDGPVDANAVLPAWRWTIDFNVLSPTGSWTVQLNPSRPSGDVWVNHQICCGNGEPPKYRNTVYDRRYRINREKAEIVNDRTRTELLAMKKRLDG